MDYLYENAFGQAELAVMAGGQILQAGTSIYTAGKQTKAVKYAATQMSQAQKSVAAKQLEAILMTTGTFWNYTPILMFAGIALAGLMITSSAFKGDKKNAT